jgi:AraC-like DNA-binding protein
MGGLELNFQRAVTRRVRPRAGPLRHLRNAVRGALGANNAGSRTSVPVQSIKRRLLSALALCMQPPIEQVTSTYHRIVRCAMDYLMEHEDDVVYIADLCLTCRISERWLREAFQRVYKMSPTQLMRIRRLNQARRMLSLGSSRQAVTDVAARFGFSDLGRFAMSYRSVFGELPSETARHRRTG